MLSIQRAPSQAVGLMIGTDIFLPAVSAIGVDGDEVVGAGGLAWGEGKCWLWFKSIKSKPSYARPVMKAAHAMLKRAVQLGETEVYTPRDDTYPSSKKLLKAVGFHFHEMREGVEIWKWVNG